MKRTSDFVELSRPGVRVLVRPEARRWSEHALDAHGSLHRAAARGPDRRRMEGRGPVYAIPARPTGGDEAAGASEDRWAVRHYRRGGAVARLLGDRYLRVGTPRPFRELRASEAVRGRGLPTPRVVAAATYTSGIFYRGDLVTTYIPRAIELATVLFDAKRRGVSGTVDRREALAETGKLIRKMALAGVLHPDLNARNVLLEWSGGAPEAHLVDLDRCRVEEGPLANAAEAMHARLVRSIKKLGKKADLPVPEGDLRALSRGVGG